MAQCQTNNPSIEIPEFIKVELAFDDTIFSEFGTKINIFNLSDKPIFIVGKSLNDYFEQCRFSQEVGYFNIYIGDAPSDVNDIYALYKIAIGKTYSVFCKIDKPLFKQIKVKLRLILYSLKKRGHIVHKIKCKRGCVRNRPLLCHHFRWLSNKNYLNSCKVDSLVFAKR